MLETGTGATGSKVVAVKDYILKWDGTTFSELTSVDGDSGNLYLRGDFVPFQEAGPTASENESGVPACGGCAAHDWDRR